MSEHEREKLQREAREFFDKFMEKALALPKPTAKLHFTRVEVQTLVGWLNVMDRYAELAVEQPELAATHLLMIRNYIRDTKKLLEDRQKEG